MFLASQALWSLSWLLNSSLAREKWPWTNISKWLWLCSHKVLLTRIGRGQIWPGSHSLPIPVHWMADPHSKRIFWIIWFYSPNDSSGVHPSIKPILQMERPYRVTKQIHGWVRAHPHFSPTAYSSCLKVKLLLAQSCLTLCNPMNCSLPGSSVHGLLQARILEWVFPSLGDLLDPGIEPRFPALQTDSLPSEPPGKPNAFFILLPTSWILFSKLTLTFHSSTPWDKLQSLGL